MRRPSSRAAHAQLAARIELTPRRAQTLLVGIDGRGGSGKSTLARGLVELLHGAIVEFDDFYLPSGDRARRAAVGDDEIGGDFDWRRLCDQVLQPLSQDRPARYQCYDWQRDEIGKWNELRPGGIVIVEGNYSIRPELRAFYDVTLWVEAPHETRLARGVARDGEQARTKWLAQWMPEEVRYLAAHDPAAHADIVVDGTR
jgi:uridine kinase